MTLKTKIFYDLNIDSIAIMQIICELEIKYDVTFNEDQLNFEEDICFFLKQPLFSSNSPLCKTTN